MPELGDKHTCADCETKYYDLGRPDATCPKCGSANRVVDDEVAAVPARAPRTKSQPKPKAPDDDAAKDDGGKDEDGDKDEEEVDLGDEADEEDESADDEE